MDPKDVSTTSCLSSYEIGLKIQSGEFTLCQKFARSKVWTIFAKVVNGEGVEMPEYVYCKICSKVFRFSKQSTSNLVKHKCYITKFNPTRSPIAELEIEESRFTNSKSPVSEIEVEKPTISATGFENSDSNLSTLLTNWIIKSCWPHEMIKNEDLKAVFQEFLRLGSKFGCDMDIDRILPKSNAILQNVKNIYKECFQRVKAEIAAIKEIGFGLTANICTDKFSNRSYLALTIHYLKSGVLKFSLLGFRTMGNEKCSSKNISATIQTILEDFDCQLSSKFIIVTDGGCKTTEALQNCQNLPCITQLLNNAIQNSLDNVPEVAQLIRSCVKLVNFIKGNAFDNSLGDLLPNYCPSRWNIMYKMLSAIENNWTAIETTLRNENETAQISSINKTHLKALTKTLQPFEDAIDTLEDTKSPTLHLVILYLHELKKSCDTKQGQNKDFDFIESLKKHLRLCLEKISKENITVLHKLALFLYPPTNKLLQFNNKEKQFIESKCIDLMKSFKTDIKPIVKQEPDSPTQPACKRKKLFSDFIESETNQDPNEHIAQEVQYYKSTRVVNKEDFDVLSWWEMQKDNFPLLYKLGCTVLSTPASSAASRHVFSSAGILLCQKLDQASNESEVQQIIFINTNVEHNKIENYSLVCNNGINL